MRWVLCLNLLAGSREKGVICKFVVNLSGWWCLHHRHHKYFLSLWNDPLTLNVLFLLNKCLIFIQIIFLILKVDDGTKAIGFRCLKWNRNVFMSLGLPKIVVLRLEWHLTKHKSIFIRPCILLVIFLIDLFCTLHSYEKYLFKL